MLSIVTDSSADLPREVVERFGISVVPLTVNVGGQEYREGVDLSAAEFAQKMLSCPDLPKTSQPSPSVFAETYRRLSRNGQLLCLTISSKLSGTHESACMAKDLSGADVEVFDTLAGSLGHGLQVMKAAQLAEQGATRRQIVAELECYRQGLTILILLYTLDNIVKGGRLSRFQGSLVNLLNLKIVLEGVEGAVVLKERVMGKQRFLRRVLDRIGESGRNLSDRMVGITHVDNLADAEYLSGEIRRLYQPQGVIVNHMGSTMGTYAGRGGMIVCF